MKTETEKSTEGDRTDVTNRTDQTEQLPPPGEVVTQLGTPCAKVWPPEWVDLVDQIEQRLGHRICGARTVNGTPCELSSNHKNGRCTFHGGFPFTGAQPNNRNASIHGLYSRRLRVCEVSCPQWNECPCASREVARLAPVKRPTCPYEQQEYNAVVTDALDRVQRNPGRDAVDAHVAHNLAILQVMFNRAAIALRNAPLVQETRVESKGRSAKSVKISPHLEAFMRISREFRSYAALLRAPKPVEPDPYEFMRYRDRAAVDTELDPDSAQKMHPVNGVDSATQARRYMGTAVKNAALGKEIESIEDAMYAITVDPDMETATEWKNRVVEAYKPYGMALPPKAVNFALKWILRIKPEGDYPDPEEEERLRVMRGYVEPGFDLNAEIDRLWPPETYEDDDDFVAPEKK